MQTHDLRHNWVFEPAIKREDGQWICAARWVCECLISYPTPVDGFCPNKIDRLLKSLGPVLDGLKDPQTPTITITREQAEVILLATRGQ